MVLLCIAPAAAADEDAAQVAVTSIVIDPATVMRGDLATITVEVTNSGTASVPISRATLRSKDIITTEDTYTSVGSIGSGNKLEFTFTVQADAPDGIYYPKFSLDFLEAPSLRYYIPFEIESTGLQVLLIDQPDSFSEGRKDTLTFVVGNPRDNEVNGVSVSIRGEGAEVTQSGFFIGNLGPDESSEISFEITPYQSTELTLEVQYRNGINMHSATLAVPVDLTTGKKIAEPVLNNIELNAEADYYRVTGDVTNAGLDVAKSVLITAGEPAIPVDPFRVYIVGALDPDDFSSFEVTFKAEEGDSVPLLIRYKDEDGNAFERSIEIAVSERITSGESEGLSPMVIGLFAFLVVAIAAIIVYSWKKKK